LTTKVSLLILSGPSNIETSPFEYLKADYNIIQATQKQNRELPLESSISWVKSHQDRDKMWGDLTPAAKVNVYADEICDEIHTRPVQQSAVFPEKVPGTKAMLLHKGRPVTKKIKHYTSIAAMVTRHKNHIVEHSHCHDPDIPENWTPATFDDIDWRIHGQVFNALSPGHKIQISKYAHGWAPTKKHLNKMDNSVDSRCFACGRLHEDTHHVLRCISDDRQEARGKATNDFNSILLKYHTLRPMAEVIINSIEQWSAEQQVTRPTFHPQEFNDELDQELHSCILTAFNKQTKIGWVHFLCGQISQP